jgi:hypothetical protein
MEPEPDPTEMKQIHFFTAEPELLKNDADPLKRFFSLTHVNMYFK